MSLVAPASIFVNPVPLIAVAMLSAVIDPLMLTLRAVSRPNCPTFVSARSKLPLLNNPETTADVIVVGPVAVLTHNLKVAVAGSVSNPVCSSLFV